MDTSAFNQWVVEEVSERQLLLISSVKAQQILVKANFIRISQTKEIKKTPNYFYRWICDSEI
jgi:hypothetical protein